MDRLEYEILEDYCYYTVVCYWFHETRYYGMKRTTIGIPQNFETLDEARKYCFENSCEYQEYVKLRDFRTLPPTVNKIVLRYNTLADKEEE